MEKFEASPDLMKFFDNLHNIKKMIQNQIEITNDPFLIEVMAKFDATFKVKDE